MNSLKKFDNTFLSRKIKLIAGVDEAGRGPIAGPVVAAAVLFDKNIYHPEINDSKKLSGLKREKLFEWIIANCLSYGIGIVDHKEIDRINILQATLKAMRIAVDKLNKSPELILIDGNKKFHSKIEIKTVVKGDSKSFAVASASIIAKVTRDRIMNEAAAEYPHYKWEKNKGYATSAHIEAVKQFGPSKLHRRTFLSKILSAQEELNL